MRLLLDTHVLLAAMDGRVSALGHGIERLIEGGENSFFVSVASLWEIMINGGSASCP